MPKTVTTFRGLEPTPYEARPFLRSKSHRKYISGINCKQNNVVYAKFQSPLGNQLWRLYTGKFDRYYHLKLASLSVTRLQSP